MEQYSNRKFYIAGFIIIIAVVYISRLFFLQVIDVTYKLSAENNSRRRVVVYPARGLIYDRNGKLLVYNQAAYDLMMEPYQMVAFDTNKLCEILEIDKNFLKSGIQKRKDFPGVRRDPFIKQITPETYAYLQEKLFEFPGFYVRPRTLRKYQKEVAAHVIGYIQEVDSSDIIKDDYYELSDYIGVSGIEKTYENWLRGEKGVKYFNVDVHGRVQGSYSNGEYDVEAEVGKNIVSTIDMDLQEFGEYLMTPFKGSIVALEPSTGEVLTLISAPTYKPGILAGRERTKNYPILSSDPNEPLFNRAILAKYPPGSTFKLINGLIGLQENVNQVSSQYFCDMGYYYGRVRVGCHNHFSPLNLITAIQNSCNAYFGNVFRKIIEDPKFPSQGVALDNWKMHVESFGLGGLLGVDMPYELSGFVPGAKFYNNLYGENRWKFITVISLSIGQGELGVTPIQMANMSSIIANRGFYEVPHLVKKLEGQDQIDAKYITRHYTSIDTANFAPIVEGMDLAVNGGSGSTAWRAKIPDITVCGKTGTAQNPGEDHSIFIAFAPKDNPKIAVAVYVENGGFGNTYAAPIAGLMIEKYLNDTIATNRKYLEDHILGAQIEYK